MNSIINILKRNSIRLFTESDILMYEMKIENIYEDLR